MNPEASNMPRVLEPPASSAELCLYLIMILPDPETRAQHVKDFCRLYEIREKRTVPLDNPLNQIAAYRAQPEQLPPLEQVPRDQMEDLVRRPRAPLRGQP
jgi:hypothetical protein